MTKKETSNEGTSVVIFLKMGDFFRFFVAFSEYINFSTFDGLAFALDHL